MEILMTHPQLTLISDISDLNNHPMEASEFGEDFFIIISLSSYYFIWAKASLQNILWCPIVY